MSGSTRLPAIGKSAKPSGSGECDLGSAFLPQRNHARKPPRSMRTIAIRTYGETSWIQRGIVQPTRQHTGNMLRAVLAGRQSGDVTKGIGALYQGVIGML